MSGQERKKQQYDVMQCNRPEIKNDLTLKSSVFLENAYFYFLSLGVTLLTQFACFEAELCGGVELKVIGRCL